MNANANGRTLVFYDGACPVCAKEIAILRKHDHAGTLQPVDIAAPEFNEHEWPVSIAGMNAALHVLRPDGVWLKAMPAIRHIYTAIGKGWMLAPTGWPLISTLFDRAYAWFAGNRMPMSAMSAMSARLGVNVCRNGACRVN